MATLDLEATPTFGSRLTYWLEQPKVKLCLLH